MARFGLLGLLQVEDAAGNPRPVAGTRQRVLLATLLVRANTVVPVAELAEIVWAGAPPAAAAALRTQVMRLRRALGPDAAARIIARDPGYVITLSTDELDISQFEALHQQAGEAIRAQRWDEAARVSSQALALWRGTALLDVESQMLRDECGERLEQLRIQTMEWQLDVEIHLGRCDQVVLPLRDLIRQYPLREHIHAQLMLALYRSGRRAEALDAYQSARDVLGEELGTEPGTELQILHQQMLTADPSLAMPEPAPRQLPGAVANFAGRSAELAALSKIMDQAGRFAPGVMVISAIGGTAGVGKTALALHWAHEVADRFPDGQLYVNLRGFGPFEAPMSPAAALRLFLNGLGVAPERIPPEPEAQAALYRGLLADRQMLIVADNARDAAQVRPLLPGSPQSLVLVTSRNQLTGLAVADGAYLMSLDVLGEDEALDLLAKRLGTERVNREPSAATELIALCARLPLALSIAAARAAARQDLSLGALAAELRATAARLDVLATGDAATDVRSVFSWSVAQLSQGAARMFRLLGVHPGPDISLPAAASLAGMPAGQAQRALTELTSAHLVTVNASGRYASHDLLHAYAAEQAQTSDGSVTVRAALHRALDHYLLTAHAGSLLLQPYRDAIKLDPPSPGTMPEALAHREQALNWFHAERQVLLAVIDRAATDSEFDKHAWQLPWAMATFLNWHGYWHELETTQESALASASRLGDMIGQAEAHRYLGQARTRFGDYAGASAQLTAALEWYQRLGNSALQARAHLDLGHVREMQGDARDALRHAKESLRLYRAAGHRVGEANALNAVGWLHAQLGGFEQALDCCRQALAAYRELGNRTGEAVTLDSLGYAHHRLGQHEDAISCYQQAMDLIGDADDRHLRAEMLTRLGDAHQAAGDQALARRAWREALGLLEELGHPDAEGVRTRLAP